MKNGPLLIVEFVPVVLGLLSICILLFSRQSNKLSSRLLAGNIACTTVYMLTAAVTQTDFFIVYPHFFRAFYPIYLLIYPLAYLYIRSVYRDESRLRKKDILHIIPAVLTALQFIPFYSLGYSEKKEYLQNLFINKSGLTLLNEGLLPAGVLSWIVNIIGLIYMIFAIKEIMEARNKPFLFPDIIKELKPIGRWAIIFVIIHISLAMFFFLTVLLNIPTQYSFFTLILANGLILSFSLIFLFARPEILYGLPRPHIIPKIEIDSKPLQTIMDDNAEEQIKDEDNPDPELPAYLAEYGRIVKTLLDEQQLFLQTGLTLTQLSKQANIPVHHLSLLFNKYWGKGFNDYINIYRINYLKKNIDNPSWQNLTIEGRGREAGFNSRITLFKAIKKHMGLSPTKFFESHQLSETKSS